MGLKRCKIIDNLSCGKRKAGNFISCLVLLQFLLLTLLLMNGRVSARTVERNQRTLLGKGNKRAYVNTATTLGQRLISGSSDNDSTILLNDGDIVTCVPLEDQPAFSELAYPKFQLKPSSTPKDSEPRSTDYPGIQRAPQTYSLNSVICPNGTFPLRAPRYSPAFPSPPPAPAPSPGGGSPVSDDGTHEHAVGLLMGDFKGVEMSMNVWRPQIENQPNETDSDFSLAQVWLASYDVLLSTIEAGWLVYEGLFGDTRPRLFVYWTADDYQETGCWNLDCPGFVQVSNKVLLGGAIEGVSATDGIQYEIQMQIFSDPETENWWLQVNDEYVGYWPGSLYNNSLRNLSRYLEWGGEVFGYETEERHYGTKMGSGAFPDAGFKRAAYFRNVRYVNTNNTLVDAKAIHLSADDTSLSCYTIARGAPQVMLFETWGVSFFFGGPGRSDICIGAG